jgi:hypothetical protein
MVLVKSEPGGEGGSSPIYFEADQALGGGGVEHRCEGRRLSASCRRRHRRRATRGGARSQLRAQVQRRARRPCGGSPGPERGRTAAFDRPGLGGRRDTIEGQHVRSVPGDDDLARAGSRWDSVAKRRFCRIAGSCARRPSVLRWSSPKSPRESVASSSAATAGPRSPR